MNRYLVEVPHDSDPTSCNAAIEIFAESGSHYLTHADFGCEDGVHDAWFVIEAGDRDEARMVVPAQYRDKTRVTKVKQYAWTNGDTPHTEHSRKRAANPRARGGEGLASAPATR